MKRISSAIAVAILAVGISVAWSAREASTSSGLPVEIDMAGAGQGGFVILTQNRKDGVFYWFCQQPPQTGSQHCEVLKLQSQ